MNETKEDYWRGPRLSLSVLQYIPFFLMLGFVAVRHAIGEKIYGREEWFQMGQRARRKRAAPHEALPRLD